MGCYYLSDDLKMLLARILRFSLLIYYIISLSFRFCFLMPGFDAFRIDSSVVVIDYLVDGLFLLDLILKFRSSSVAPTDVVGTKKGKNVSTFHIVQMVDGVELKKASKWKILGANLSVVVDFLILMPIELIGLFAGQENYYLLRITKLIKVKDYFRYWHDISDSLQHFNFAGANYGIKRVMLLIISQAIVGHLAACIFYIISYRALVEKSEKSWIYFDSLAHLGKQGQIVYTSTLNYRYLRAIYWSVQTLQTVGFGDIVAHSEAETWFCILFFYVSAFLLYYSIANLMEVLTNFDSARTEALIKQSRFEQYATCRKLPKELVQRVRSYYDHQWKLLKGIDEREIFAQLPPNISQQIKQHLVRDLLVQVEALAELNKGLLNSLSDNIDSYVYNPEDVIILHDSRVAGMFIISTGDVQVESSDGETKNLRAKQHFCLASLVKSYSSSQTYKAKSFCEVLFLKGTVFRHLCKSYLTKPEYDLFMKSKLRPSYEEEKEQQRIRQIPTLKERKSSRQIDYIKRQIQNAYFPDSEIRLLWDSVLFCGVVFYFTSIPLLLAIMMRQDFMDSSLALLFSGSIVDILFFLDAVLLSTTFGFWHDGMIMMERDKIWKHFWTQNPLPLILLSLLPLDIIVGFTYDTKLYSILRLLKVFHCRRFPYFAEKFMQFFIAHTGIVISFEMSRFIALYFMLFQLCHWAGCVWRLAADVASLIFHYEKNWVEVDKHGILNIDYHSMPAVEYSRSIYWAASVMSSIGFPDILATNKVELAVIIVIMFFGYLMFNTCLGAIANLMSSFNREKREFNMKVDRVRQVLKHNKIPAAIETKVINYFDHLWTRYNGVNEEELLNSLPPTLRGAVVRFVIGPLLTSIPFFNSCSEPMENLLLSMVESRCFLDGDALMVAGELGKEMFIIERGSVLITSADKSVIFATLGPGSYVGESCLLEVSERTASVFALGYVDTYVLSNESFFKAAEKFPDEYDDIVNEIQIIIAEKKMKNEKITQEVQEVRDDRSKAAQFSSFTNDSLNNSPESMLDSPIKDSSRQNLDKQSSLLEQSEDQRSAELVGSHDHTPMSSRWWHCCFCYFCSCCDPSKIAFIAPIHPDSNYKYGWEIVMFFVCIYHAILTPLRLALLLPPWLFWIDYFLDALNIFDCYLAATALGQYHAGQVLMTSRSISERYYRTRFFTDLVIIIPYDLLALLHLVLNSKYSGFLRSIFRIPKLVKLSHFDQYYKRVEKVCIDYNINYVIVRVVSITGTIIIIGHWVACGWMMLANYGVLNTCSNTDKSYLDCQYVGSWVEQQILSNKLPADGGDQWARYIRSINWAIPTLTSEIIGDIFPFNQNESMYTFAVMFCGLSINGAIIGSIVSLVSDANVELTKHYRNIETLRTNLLKKHISYDLIQSSIGFLQYLATDEGMLTVLRDEVFSSLPHSIKVAIDQEMKTLPYLRHCPFFDFFPDELLRGISARLRTRVYCKNNKIINFGDLGHEMFFLEKGKVDIVSGDGKILFATLEEGSFFGETAIFFKSTRAATVRAASPFCVCLVLSKEDLNQELRSLEFDEVEVLNIFKRLQVSNQRRNTAVELNLKYSLVKTHKLSKIVKHDDENQTSNAYEYKIRKFLTPDGLPKAIWDFFGLVLLIYYTFSIPLYIAFFFGSDVQLYSKRVIYEVLISLYWLIDLLFKLKFFSYYSDLVSQKLITDPELIWNRYFNTSLFWQDLFASLPYELLILDPNITYVAVFMIRAIHLLKIPQLPQYLTMLENHLRKLFSVHIGRTTSLVVKAGLAYVALNHLLACGYFMIHRYAEINSDITYVIADSMADYDSTSGRHNICNTRIRYCYARSMYFVLGTLTSVGYGDISPYTNKEFIYEQAVAILGAYIAAIFLGYCGTYQTDKDNSGDRGFKKSLGKFEAFVKYRHLPGYLHNSIITQHTYIYKKTNSLEGGNSQLLQKLSEPSKIELSLYLNDDILQSVQALRDASAPLLRRLAARLKPQLILENTYIYRAGDIGQTIFFLLSGRVQVSLSSDKKSLDAFGIASLRLLLHKQTHHGPIYEKGDHFGEFCLLSSSGLRADSALALTGCEVYYLSKEELWQEFLYIEPKMRREFIHDLFTRVGKTKHCKMKFDNTHEDDTSDTRITTMFRMAFGIMEDIYDELDTLEHDGDTASEEEEETIVDESLQTSDVECFEPAEQRMSDLSTENGPVILRRSAQLQRTRTLSREVNLHVQSISGIPKDIIEGSRNGSTNNSPRTSEVKPDKRDTSSINRELASLIKQDSAQRDSHRSSMLYKQKNFTNRKRSVFSAVTIMAKHKLQNIANDEKNSPSKFVSTLDKIYDAEANDNGAEKSSDEKNDDNGHSNDSSPPPTLLKHISPEAGRRKHAPLRISNIASPTSKFLVLESVEENELVTAAPTVEESNTTLSSKRVETYVTTGSLASSSTKQSTKQSRKGALELINKRIKSGKGISDVDVKERSVTSVEDFDSSPWLEDKLINPATSNSMEVMEFDDDTSTHDMTPPPTK